MANFRRIFKAGVLGTILGAILGLLFAPKPGKETRGELKKKFDKARTKGIKAAKEIAMEVKEIKEETQADIEEVKKTFKK